MRYRGAKITLSALMEWWVREGKGGGGGKDCSVPKTVTRQDKEELAVFTTSANLTPQQME